VNGPEILHLIRDDLQGAVARQAKPPIPRPMHASPWLAMSVFAEGHPARARRPRAQSGSDPASRRAGKTLATDRLHRIREYWGGEPGGRRARDRGPGWQTTSLCAQRRMGSCQLDHLRTQASAEVPGGRRPPDGLRASPRTREGARRAAAPDDPRLDLGRNSARVRPGAGVGALVGPRNGSTSFDPREPAPRTPSGVRPPV
jgi:hypothetical protein